jgi:oligopeptide transport system substrate-binding protein
MEDLSERHLSRRQLIRSGATALAAGSSLSLVSACSRTDRARLTHAPNVLNRGNGADISSLDPHFITGNWEAYVIGDCILGLTTEGPDGSAIPGAADRWDTSSDGRTWTFHLRDHRWSDGSKVTADDFVFAWRRILDPMMAAPYAYYLYVVKNARDINKGKAPANTLGIVAKDERTLVVELNEPAPYLPEWLQHQTTWPVPRHTVLAKGRAWSRPENFVANGPYVPASWVPNDRVVLKKNPLFFEASRVRIGTVNYFPTQDNQAALKQMVAGELDIQEPFPIAAIDWLHRNMPAELDVRPNLSNAYLIFNFLKPQFQDKRVREAMCLAYDRETIANKILKLGDAPAYAFVPPGTANYPGGASLGFKRMPMVERVKRARALMSAAGYGADNHMRATYLTVPNPDVQRTAAVIQAMMRRIFVDLEISSVDASIFYKTLANHDFELAPSSWIGDFNDASTFLDLLYSGNGNNYGSYSSSRFDRLYESAKLQSDAVKRGALMAQAEQVALDDFAVIPTRFRQSQNLVEPYVKGWRSRTPNLRNFHRTRWLWIEPVAVTT